MARTGGRPTSHIQEARPASGARPPSPPPADEERPPVAEGRQTGWRLAVALWAVVFLFLAALLVFDLVTGLLYH